MTYSNESPSHYRGKRNALKPTSISDFMYNSSPTKAPKESIAGDEDEDDDFEPV